ncbi:MAG: acyl-CoA reductase [Chthoniobacterales bacterium]
MTACERVAWLVPVVARFPEMGAFGDKAALLELIRLELGSEDALETGAVLPPRRLLHIISANTAMAGMQSLVRGLILGSLNWCKTPGAGLPRFEEFVKALPEPLRMLVKVSPTLLPHWLEMADAVVVFGSDATVEKFRNETKPGQIFAGYGNRWSGAVIFSDDDFSSIPSLVRDVCLYDQMGCLSAQIVWLHDSIDVEEYGTRLTAELGRYGQGNPTAALSFEDAASVARWRLSAEWQTVEHEGNRVWLSTDDPVWGVQLSRQKTPPLSCLHRHVSLQIFSDVPDLGELASSVSTLGFWPFSSKNRIQLKSSGASRLCAVGDMQFPQPTWQQDGFPALGRLVRRQGAG